jgi:pimeloyl-ACP methyl ester carboxylesterase
VPLPLIALLLPLAILLLGVTAQAVATEIDRRRYPRPGKIVNGLHIHCTGSGSPVVLEAGIAATSVSWRPVQNALSSFARVCSYDRPGLGWSPCAAQPRSPEQFVHDLRTVVRHAGTPVVLVGHSFGGLLVRLYAAAHPEDVRALVLVDPALLREWANPSPHKLAMLRRGVALSRRGAALARLGFVRFALAALMLGARPLAKGMARVSSGGAASVTERIVGEVRKLPPELWPVVRSHWCRDECFRGMAQHLESLPAVASAVATTTVPANIPVVVISGGHLNGEELAEHRALGRHIVAEGSAHWVHLDRPDVIVEAVRSLLHGYGA